jgi:HAD superfamily hydrolase (TIGR01509 family)
VVSVAPFRAVIFDMDGTLTDSEPAFHAAVNDILARYGKHVPIEEYGRFIGMETPPMWTQMIELQALPATLNEILEAYEPVLMARLCQPRPALPGARDLIVALRERDVPIALCTASYKRWVEVILPAAGLDGLFDVLSTCDMVTKTKPQPEPYLLAAEKLGVPPAECVVIEDSTNGLTSALSAGMHVVQLRATRTAAAPMPGVARIITSLREFPLELVVAMPD